MAELPYRRGTILGTIYGRVLRLFRAGLGGDVEEPPPPAATVPGPPLSVVATASGPFVTVTWQPPLSTGGSPITGYQVTAFDVDSDTPLSPYPITGAGVASLVTPALTIGRMYTFTVRAVNAVGSSAPSAPSSPITISNPPGPVRNLVATAGPNRVSATWVAPSSGLPVTTYVIAWNKNGSPAGGTQTTATSIDLTGPSITNDSDFTVEVHATNFSGAGPIEVSNVVQPNWDPVVLSHHGRHTQVTHANGDDSNLLFSRDTGVAEGVGYHHIVDPGDSPFVSELKDGHVEDRILPNDEVRIIFPVVFPEWSTSAMGTATVFRLAAPDGTTRIAIEADHSQVRLRVMGTVVHSENISRTTTQWYRHKFKMSPDVSTGWSEARKGAAYPGATELAARSFRATMDGADAYLEAHWGLRNSQAVTARRRLRHHAVEMYVTRDGVERRIRLDCEADVIRVGHQNYPTSNGNDYNYATLVTRNAMDRIRLINSVGGRLAWKYTTKINDWASNGQRTEMSLIRRPVYKNGGPNSNYAPDSPQKQLIEGDKCDFVWYTWVPAQATFPLLTNRKWTLTAQFHQLSESSGSPPHEWTTEGQTTNYVYRINKLNPAQSAVINHAVWTLWPNNTIPRERWIKFSGTMLVSADPAKGYVRLLIDDVEVVPKTYAPTLNLPTIPASIVGTNPQELIGEDIPEMNFFSIGQYGDEYQQGGYSETRTIYHTEAELTVYRDPAFQHAYDP